MTVSETDGPLGNVSSGGLPVTSIVTDAVYTIILQVPVHPGQRAELRLVFDR